MGKYTVKHWAVIFGIFFVVVGILGFVPGCTPMGMLFGTFKVNGAHNFLHLITGIVALWVGLGKGSAKTFFKVFGIVYVILGLLGFLADPNDVLGMFASNNADNWVHLILGVVGLYFGYNKKVK
jgi:hypothetical protein